MFPLPYATQMGLHYNNYGPQLKQMQNTDFSEEEYWEKPKVNRWDKDTAGIWSLWHQYLQKIFKTVEFLTSLVLIL